MQWVILGQDLGSLARAAGLQIRFNCGIAQPRLLRLVGNSPIWEDALVKELAPPASRLR